MTSFIQHTPVILLFIKRGINYIEDQVSELQKGCPLQWLGKKSVTIHSVGQ